MHEIADNGLKGKIGNKKGFAFWYLFKALCIQLAMVSI